MFNQNTIKRDFLLMLLAVIFIAVLSLTGCGGSGGGGDDGDDGGDGTPVYSELDVSFGGVVLDHFADQTLTLRNAGSISITLGDIEDPALPFTIVTDGCSGETLSASGTCDLQIRFSPTVMGDQEGFFSVPLSGSSTAFVGVNMDGTGNGLNLTITQVDTSGCDTVKLIASVTDQYDDYVENLTAANFTLIEDTTGLSELVTGYASDVSVVLALDSSGSVSGVLPDIKAAANLFVDALDASDEVAVFTFSETPDEVIGFTAANDPALATEIDDITTTAAADTALYDALIYVCDYFDTAPAATNDRRAIVLITDGNDTYSTSELADAIDAAQAAGIPIFVIGMGSDDDFIQIMQQLAEETGGQYFDAPVEGVLDVVYPDIAQLLTHQYELTYTSNSEGGTATTVYLTVTYDDGGGEMTGEDSREFEGCP